MNTQPTKFPTFWVTFRIKKVGNYDARYEALKAAISSVLEDRRWWVEPTSFIVFRSRKTIDQVAAAVKSALDTSADMALIGMTEVIDARVIGHLEDPELFDFMPHAKRA